MKSNGKLLIVILMTTVLTVIITSSCGRNRISLFQEYNEAQVKLVAFNQEGIEDPKLTSQLNLTEKSLDNSTTYIVSVSKLKNANTSYVEFRYNPKLQHPTDVSFGSIFQSSKRGVLATAPLNHPGVIPVAQVLIGSGISITDSGELFRITFKNGAYPKKTSGYKQSDSIVQNLVYSSGTDILEWNNVFRGDANGNQVVDFADFGVVGAYYGKKPSVDPKYTIADCDNKGTVDFADFGVIGTAYNEKVSYWYIWYSPTSPVDLSGTSSDTLKVTETNLTVTKSAEGFNHYALKLSTSSYKPGTDIAAYVAPGTYDVMYKSLGAECSTTGGGGLAAPTNVNASDGTYPDKIVITWTKVTGATGYTIYRDFASPPLANVGDTDIYEDTTVPDKNTHTYWLTATDSVNTSPNSANDTGKLFSSVIAAPTNVYATLDNYADGVHNALPDKIVISWSEVPEATGYRVFRMDDFTNPIATLGKELTFEDTSVVQPDTATHEYRIKSFNDTSVSDWSISVFGNLKNVTQTWDVKPVISSPNEFLDVKAIVMTNGNPAILTHQLTTGLLLFISANNPTPSDVDWVTASLNTISTTPVDTIDTLNPPIDYTMGLLGGKPIVAYFNPAGDGSLEIMVSSKEVPTILTDWKKYTVKQAEGGKKIVVKYISIADKAGEPVFSYLCNYDGGITHLEYAQCKFGAWPPSSPADFEIMEIDSDDATFSINYNTTVLTLLDGTPAIAYYKNNPTADGSGIQFAESPTTRPISSEWYKYPLVESNLGQSTGYYSSAALIDGYPAVATFNSTYNYAMYHYSNVVKPGTTSNWKRGVVEGGFNIRGKYISLVNWDNKPFMSYLDKSMKTMRFAQGLNTAPGNFYNYMLGPTTDNTTYNYVKWNSGIICNGKPASVVVENHISAPIWTINYLRMTAP